MNKLLTYIHLCCLVVLFAGCRQPELQYADFDEVLYVDFSMFQPTHIEETQVLMDDGTLNPNIRPMENPVVSDDNPAGMQRIASTTINAMASDILGAINSSKVKQIAGTYVGHDIDGKEITLSGKVLLPASGAIKNIIVVSHYTIGAYFEAPSECFPFEGIFAAKGYAVVIADYIGYGVTSHMIHPYLHARSTARSVVDMVKAVIPYLDAIGKAPQSDKLILFGYSQGGATTLAVMNMMENDYAGEFSIKKVYAGAGPYDLAATFDYSMEQNNTGIPCAIPMIVQGISYGERLGLNMADFFQPGLLQTYNELINSKLYTVRDINRKINANRLSDIMTPEGRNKRSAQTARLYLAMMHNSVLDFEPQAPLFLFHSTTDDTVPFVNSLKAEEKFKKLNVKFDFHDYGNHMAGFLKFLHKVSKDL